jgi:1-deoxy-D-xylulose-5-phosphate reductoisomerase
MANKGLEIIETHYLFDLKADQISVLIHPQSMIHSMIGTLEGSFYAQISFPDMRIPIQNALTFPEIKMSPFGKLDFTDLEFSFTEPDYRRYPLIPLAYEAIERGGCTPAAFNAANEAAVDAFRKGLIRFIDIAPVVEKSLEHDWSRAHSDFNSVLRLHDEVWEYSSHIIRIARESLK